MDKVLINTDVILDFLFDRPPDSEAASNIFSLCEKKSILGFVTPLICANVYLLLKKTASHEKVAEKMNLLLTITEILTMDKSVVIKALNAKFRNYEDALQNYAAVNAGNVDVILTRNVKDFKNSEIAVMTPEEYLKTGISYGLTDLSPEDLIIY